MFRTTTSSNQSIISGQGSLATCELAYAGNRTGKSQMDLWKEILISWANILDVANPVQRFLDLKSEFVFKFCDHLTEDRTIESHEQAEQFLNVKYPRIVLRSITDEEERLVIAASLLLIECSLHGDDSDIRTKQCNLPREHQTFVMSFLEGFINVPQEDVTRNSIKTNILQTFRRDLYQTVKSTPTSTTYDATPSSRKSSSRRKTHRIDKLKNQIESLEKNQIELQDENYGLTETIIEMKNKLDCKDREINKLKMDLNSLPRTLSPTRENSKECTKCKFHERKIMRMEEEVQQLNDEKSEFEERQIYFEKTLARHEEVTKNLKFQFDEAAMALAGMETRNEALVNGNTALTAQNKKFLLYVQELEEVIKELKTRPSMPPSVSYHEVSSPVNTLADEFFDLKLQELMATCEKKDVVISSQLKEIDELKSSLASLRLIAEARNEKLDETEAQLEKVLADIKTLADDNKTLSEELHLASRRVEVLSEENKDLGNKLVEIQSTIEQTKKENDRLTSEGRNAADEVQSWKARVSRLKGQLHRLEAKRNELTEIVEMKTLKVQELEILHENNRKSMKKFQDENESNLAINREKMSKLNDENRNLKTYVAELEADKVKNSQLRNEYETKLEQLGVKAKEVYSAKVNEFRDKAANQIAVIRNDLIKEKEARDKAEKRAKELSDQLLAVEEEKRALLLENRELQKRGIRPVGAISNTEFTESVSVDHNSSSCSESFEDSLMSTHSLTRSSGLPKGIKKVFPSADEDGEIFESRCLAEMNAGICNVPRRDEDRLSVWMERNAMCPPHLRSTYPVESQFLDPEKLQENELRNPNIAGIKTSISLVQKSPKQSTCKVQPRTKQGFFLRENVSPRRSTPSRIRRALFHCHKGDQNTPPGNLQREE